MNVMFGMVYMKNILWLGSGLEQVSCFLPYVHMKQTDKIQN